MRSRPSNWPGSREEREQLQRRGVLSQAALVGSADELGAERWRRGDDLQLATRDEVRGQVSFHDVDTIEVEFSELDGPESGADSAVLLVVMAGQSLGQVYHLGAHDREVLLGRGPLCDIRLNDGEVSRQHASVRWCEDDRRFVVIDHDSQNGTYVNGRAVDGSRPLAEGDKIHLGPSALLRVASPYGDEAKYARTMHGAALRDPLTGAFNRRYLDDRLISEFAYSTRHDAPFSVMLIDVDRFKEVNDQHGHGVGDVVLADVVELIRSTVRTEDLVARYGGDEIAILCRGTSETEALRVAQRVRRAVEEGASAAYHPSIGVTVSIGVAGLAETAAVDGKLLLTAADIALYAAKAAGRNRCRAASSTLDDELS